MSAGCANTHMLAVFAACFAAVTMQTTQSTVKSDLEGQALSITTSTLGLNQK